MVYLVERLKATTPNVQNVQMEEVYGMSETLEGTDICVDSVQ